MEAPAVGSARPGCHPGLRLRNTHSTNNGNAIGGTRGYPAGAERHRCRRQGVTSGSAAGRHGPGGTNADTFKFVTGGNLNGTINGGSGANTLDYSGYTTSGVIVDLPLDTATHTTGISNILNVTGSKNGGDILVGDANNNILKELNGHNIVIGGAGADTLTAGKVGDILIAGTTSYDSNVAQLQSFLATWVTSTPGNYSTVLSNLMSAGLDASHVFNDSSADILNGNTSGKVDRWFFAHTSGGSTLDTVNHLEAGETLTAI